MATPDAGSKTVPLAIAVLGGLLLVITQFAITQAVLKNGSNEAVVSHWGFAGTLVSIILAVLAIVYSYYQNFSQQRDSGNIASQIQLMRNTVEQLQDSEQEMRTGLNRFDEIGARFDELRARFDEFGPKLDESHAVNIDTNLATRLLQENLDGVKEDLRVKVAGEHASPSKAVSSLPDARYIAARASPLQLVCYLAICKAEGLNLPLLGAFGEIVKPILDKQGTTAIWQWFLQGYLRGSAYLLGDVRLLEFDASLCIANVDPAFAAAVSERANILLAQPPKDDPARANAELIQGIIDFELR